MQKHGSDNRWAWLALHLVPGLGNIAFKNLLERFGGPEEIFCATLADLMEVDGLRREIACRIVAREYTSDPEEVLSTLARRSARVITYADPDYPPPLREIHDPPMVLYVKGRNIPRKSAFVAVVGSRNPTPYGLKTAEKIGQGLARRGVGVASGMARGIDSAAHWGCLSGRGFTLAVLGTGIDTVYPYSNRKLYENIIRKGAVLTEFPLGTPPEPKNFPIRNRLISGLSRGVVVVEATMRSGSLITASVALEQGREVFAVPGSVHSFKSTGCHFLIKQGAKLVESPDDVLDELGMNYPFAPKTDTFKEKSVPALEDSERALYEIIGDYPLHIDEIAREGNMQPGEVSSLLTRMELKGIIRQLPGKMFVR
jgi:DNA processing protein